MRGLFPTIFLLLVALMIVSTEAGKNKKGKGSKGDCTDWRFGNCVANNGDCGIGVREGTCNDQIKNLKCKVPCNWKKDFGADCKYKFGTWSECDAATGIKSRSGTIVKALYDAECQPVIVANKPCSTKNKAKSKGKKGKGKGN